MPLCASSACLIAGPHTRDLALVQCAQHKLLLLFPGLDPPDPQHWLWTWVYLEMVGR